MPAVISLHGCTRCQRSTDPRLRVAPEGSGEPPVVKSDARPGPGERVAAAAGAATPRSVGPRTDRAPLAIDAEGSGQRRGLGRGRPGYGGTFRPRDGCVRAACSRVRARGRAGPPRTGRDVDAGTLVAWAQAGCPGGRGRAAESAPRRGRYRCLEDAAACGVPSSCAAQRRAGRPRADAGVVHSSQESCGQLSPSSLNPARGVELGVARVGRAAAAQCWRGKLALGGLRGRLVEQGRPWRTERPRSTGQARLWTRRGYAQGVHKPGCRDRGRVSSREPST